MFPRVHNIVTQSHSLEENIQQANGPMADASLVLESTTPAQRFSPSAISTPQRRYLLGPRAASELSTNSTVEPASPPYPRKLDCTRRRAPRRLRPRLSFLESLTRGTTTGVFIDYVEHASDSFERFEDLLRAFDRGGAHHLNSAAGERYWV